MNQQTTRPGNSACNCTECPGAGCQCGCQAAVSLANEAQPSRCACGPACGCKASTCACA